jgi:hypothetical protein
MEPWESISITLFAVPSLFRFSASTLTMVYAEFTDTGSCQLLV